MSEFKRIAKFEKVSQEQFIKDFSDAFPEVPCDDVREIYESIKLPRRATSGSAGYDFFAPFSFSLKPGETIKIPTGIRCKIEDGWVLKIYPRSGLGFKFRLQLHTEFSVFQII